MSPWLYVANRFDIIVRPNNHNAMCVRVCHNCENTYALDVNFPLNKLFDIFRFFYLDSVWRIESFYVARLFLRSLSVDENIPTQRMYRLPKCHKFPLIIRIFSYGKYTSEQNVYESNRLWLMKNVASGVILFWNGARGWWITRLSMIHAKTQRII